MGLTFFLSFPPILGCFSLCASISKMAYLVIFLLSLHYIILYNTMQIQNIWWHSFSLWITNLHKKLPYTGMNQKQITYIYNAIFLVILYVKMQQKAITSHTECKRNLSQISDSHFNIKTLFQHVRISIKIVKMVWWLSHLYNGNPHIGKVAFLYWNRGPDSSYLSAIPLLMESFVHCPIKDIYQFSTENETLILLCSQWMYCINMGLYMGLYQVSPGILRITLPWPSYLYWYWDPQQLEK